MEKELVYIEGKTIKGWMLIPIKNLAPSCWGKSRFWQFKISY